MYSLTFSMTVPQWSVPVDVLFDMRVHLRVLVDLPGGLRLQYADQVGRRDLRRHGYQHMDVVPVRLRRQQLRIEPGAEVADMAFQELRYLIVDDGFSETIWYVSRYTLCALRMYSMTPPD